MPRPKLEKTKGDIHISIDETLLNWLIKYSIETSQPKSQIISDLIKKLKRSTK